MKTVLTFCLFACLHLVATPKVVVFDFGGVVAKVDRSPIVHFLAESFEVSSSKIYKDFSSDRLYQSLDEPLSFWEQYSGKKLGLQWHRELELQKRGVVQKIPGMEELIQDLKERGVQVALLSNTKAIRARFIEREGGYDLFDPILLSCHLGCKKPNLKIYEKLLHSLPYAPEECLFIDNAKKNVKAAKQCGLDGIVFQSVEHLQEKLKKRGL